MDNADNSSSMTEDAYMDRLRGTDEIYDELSNNLVGRSKAQVTAFENM